MGLLLRLQLSHGLLRCRSTVIVKACERRRLDLERFRSPAAFRGRPRWQVWAVEKLQAAYYRHLSQWYLFADLQADLKVAAKYGAFSVSSWIQRSELAKYCVVECLAFRIVPLAEDGVLLPVSETCQAFHALFEDEWLKSIKSQLIAGERNSVALSPTVLRLGALQNGLQAGGGMDPRSAARTFDDLSSLEESAVRNEVDISSYPVLVRPEGANMAGAVLIPLMQKELDRNAELVSSWTLMGLPDLVGKKKELAYAYIPDYRILLASDQRESLVPGLLISFLTVTLSRAGWFASYSQEDGVTLALGQRRISPSSVIHDLLDGNLDREAFLQIIE